MLYLLTFYCQFIAKCISEKEFPSSVNICGGGFLFQPLRCRPTLLSCRDYVRSVKTVLVAAVFSLLLTLTSMYRIGLQMHGSVSMECDKFNLWLHI